MKSFYLLLTATALCTGAIGCRTAPTRITYLPGGESSSGEDANQKELVKDTDPLDKDRPIAIAPPIDPNSLRSEIPHPALVANDPRLRASDPERRPSRDRDLVPTTRKREPCRRGAFCRAEQR